MHIVVLQHCLLPVNTCTVVLAGGMLLLKSDNSICICRCAESVLGFLAEALASLARRPQYYWGLLQSLQSLHTCETHQGPLQCTSCLLAAVHFESQTQTCAAADAQESCQSNVSHECKVVMQKRGRHSHVPCLFTGGNTAAEPQFSLLGICILQQALKVACSSKLPSESRTWVSAYTAAVLAQLLRIQTGPQLLCHVIIDLFQQATDWKSAAPTTAAREAEAEAATEASRSAGRAPDSSSAHAEHAVVLSLPVQAQPLISLLGFAQDLLKRWQSPGRTANAGFSVPHSTNDEPEDVGKGSRKRRTGSQTPLGESKSRKKQRSGPYPTPSVQESADSGLEVKYIACSHGTLQQQLTIAQ